MEGQLLTEYETPLCADSVEWCPIYSKWDLFVCGNYQLARDESNGQSDAQRERFGSILLFQADPEFRLLQVLETAAILDLKWCHNEVNQKPIFAAVTAKATLDLFILEEDEGQQRLTFYTNYSFHSDDDILLLSVDWSTGKYQSNDPQLVCSDSKGQVHLFHLLPSGLVLLQSWKIHAHEAWISAFDYWHPSCIYSGGDDAVFAKISNELSAPTTNRSHESGVTAIHSNKNKEHIVVTGSYDSVVRYWDGRSLKTPIKSVKMPGPVWRVKWDPMNQDYLLAACMDGGVAIIAEQDASQLHIVGTFKGHKSMVYGADWCYDWHKRRIATCSFYDKLLCMVQVDNVCK